MCYGCAIRAFSAWVLYRSSLSRNRKLISKQHFCNQWRIRMGHAGDPMTSARWKFFWRKLICTEMCNFKNKIQTFFCLAYVPHQLPSEKLWTRPRWWPYNIMNTHGRWSWRRSYPKRGPKAEALIVMAIIGRSCHKQDKMSQLCINGDWKKNRSNSESVRLSATCHLIGVNRTITYCCAITQVDDLPKFSVCKSTFGICTTNLRAGLAPFEWNKSTKMLTTTLYVRILYLTPEGCIDERQFETATPQKPVSACQ